MTFKHSKFIDSVTMRSFEKVAMEKGLIKHDPLEKIASKKLDLTISSNLMQNVLTLCAGLKEAGMNSYAKDLEIKFLNYKEATSLYETSKETGDDLVDQAHPKGSYEVADVEGDALVETILDQHLKMINMVNKKLTGKVSSSSYSRDIINAVKYSLGQTNNTQTLETLNANMKIISEKLVSVLTKIKTNADEDLPFLVVSVPAGAFIFAKNLTSINLANLKRIMGKLASKLTPRKTLGMDDGVNPETWAIISPAIDYANRLIDTAININNMLMNIKREEAEKSYNESPTENASVKLVPADLNEKLNLAGTLEADVATFRSILTKERDIDLPKYMTYSGRTDDGVKKANSFIKWLTAIISNYNATIRNMKSESVTMTDAFNSAPLFKGIQDADGYASKKAKLSASIEQYKNSWS